MGTERETLGRGGYGSVYKMRYPPGSHTFVAVKEIDSDMFSTEDNLKEIQALQKLTKQKNIVRIIDYSVKGTLMKIYMELCNKSLHDYIFKEQNQVLLPALPPKIEMLRQLSDALDFCHSQRIVHKDIKPLNILVKDENNSTVLKICDFGFSKLLSSRTGNRFPAHDPSSLPATSPDFKATGGGTYGYRCAELLQAEPSKGTVATAKVDVFALGIVFFQIICGPVHPFGGFNEAEKNILLGEHYLERHLPKGCEAFHLIDRMLSLSPSERPTMAAVCRHPLLMTDDERLFFLDCQVYGVSWDNRYQEAFPSPAKFAWERLPGIVCWKDIPAYRILQLEEYNDWSTAFFGGERIDLFHSLKWEDLNFIKAADLSKVIDHVTYTVKPTYK